ncbi:MAG: 16S rRNA (cytosine(1402)-N(4))-methyltransferase RsmH [Clostridia bacterium]|nr:16S rRNA (cytosine(1402)-N(4))-methyltransferase RsmH [Clostridia bacterium]
MEFFHEPIMLNQIKESLKLKPFDVFVDCTLGGAGHSSEIIKLLPKGKLVGIDKDDEALNYSKLKLKDYSNVAFVKDDFKNFSNILDDLNIDKVNGILVDLGVSSYQIDTAERGFSFRFDGPLDMRMDKSQKLTAYDVVNNYSKKDLIQILKIYGEERFSSLIVNNIIKHREGNSIKTTRQLNEIIEECLPKRFVFKSGGAAKRTFQALRIEVNKELLGLEKALNSMIERLEIGGRIFVLSFHSLEDRIVKNVFQFHSKNCICPPETPICICGHKADIKLINRKPITASEEEKENNSRSSSAKLRIAEKV